MNIKYVDELLYSFLYGGDNENTTDLRYMITYELLHKTRGNSFFVKEGH